MCGQILNFNLESSLYLKSDPRVRDKILMGSPLSIGIILLTYVAFSKLLISFIRTSEMKYSKCSFERAFLFFNLYASLSSIYFTYKTVKYMEWSNFNFRCTGLDLSNQDETVEVRKIIM